MATPDPVTLDELPCASAASGDDTLLISVDGAARKITLDSLLASVAQDAKLVSGSSAQRKAAAPAELILWYETDSGGWWTWRPGSAAWAKLATHADIQMPGFISGLQLSRTGGTSLSIRAGSLEIEGALYNLPQDISLTVAVHTGLVWRAVTVCAPDNSNVLTTTDFSSIAIQSTGIERRRGGWYQIGTNRRVVGLYPSASGAILPGYRVAGDSYIINVYTMVDTASPPTSATSLALGLPPINENIKGVFNSMVYANAATHVTLRVNNVNALVLSAGGTAADRQIIGEHGVWSTDGYADVTLITNGNPAQLRMNLLSILIPSGMAS